MPEKLGDRLRRRRNDKKLGLREAAGKLNISPTYLSRIETNEEKSPPGEDVLRALAKLLDENFDELMTLAGRIPTDVAKYISSDPGMPQFLRTARDLNLSPEELTKRLGTKGRK
ncbi:MAG: helix-turn-helix transcriptional regulator [Myxococcaceae bacterium]